MAFQISFSKIDMYRACPFMYKCASDPRTKREFARDTIPLTQGSLIHGVLNSYYKELLPEGKFIEVPV